MSADTNYLHSLLDDADESPARQAWTIRAQDKKIRKQAAEIERLRADLEREQLRLSACGVIALSNTPESAAKARQIHDDYKSASCDDVARAVDREMALRAERDEHARWRQKLADDLHDRESEISDAWQALRDAGVQSEQSIADGIELMRRQFVEAETDAQRYRWLRGGADIPPHSSRWARWEVRYWCGRHWNTLFAEQIDAAIDALIAQAEAALGSER